MKIRLLLNQFVGTGKNGGATVLLNGGSSSNNKKIDLSTMNPSHFLNQLDACHRGFQHNGVGFNTTNTLPSRSETVALKLL